MTRRRNATRRHDFDPLERTRVRMKVIRRLEHGPILPDDLDGALEENLYWILRNREFLRKMIRLELNRETQWEPFVFRVHPELDPTHGKDGLWQQLAATARLADSE